MTDPTSDPTSDPLDEVASAALDGEATPDESARAAVDPSVAARMEAFREVRDALHAGTAPAPDAARESAIRMALAAFDAEQAGSSQGARRDRRGLVHLGDRRPGRLRWARAVGVAAAVALLAALVPSLLDAGGDGDDGDVTASEEEQGVREGAAEDSGGDAFDTGLAAPAPGDAPAAGPQVLAAGAAAVDLGPHPDLAALLAAVRRHLAGPVDGEGPPATPDPATARCLELAGATAAGDGRTVVLVAVGALDGRGVGVVVLDHPSAGRSVLVLEPGADCAAVAAERI